MRGYYNDIKKLDRRECQELIKYSNSEKEKELARQRILELEKIAVQEAKATIRIAKKKEEQNRKPQNRTSQTNSNREHQTYKNAKSDISTNKVSASFEAPNTIWTTVWNVIKCIGMFLIALNMLIKCLN